MSASEARGGRSEEPRLERADGRWTVTFPGDPDGFEVIAWTPPRLVLGRGSEVRTFSLAGSADGTWIGDRGRVRFVPRPSRGGPGATSETPGHDDLSAPMPGKILQILVAEGDQVQAGQRLVIIEAMKMENPLRAPHDSVVTRIHVQVGSTVTPGDTIVELEASP